MGSCTQLKKKFMSAWWVFGSLKSLEKNVAYVNRKRAQMFRLGFPMMAWRVHLVRLGQDMILLTSMKVLLQLQYHVYLYSILRTLIHVQPPVSVHQCSWATRQVLNSAMGISNMD